MRFQLPDHLFEFDFRFGGNQPLAKWNPGEDLKEWLNSQCVDHRFGVNTEIRSGPATGTMTMMCSSSHLEIIPYIEIDDPQDAMLFKLTWM